MIFDGNYKPGSKEIAERLAGKVREFNGARAEDAWLLANPLARLSQVRSNATAARTPTFLPAALIDHTASWLPFSMPPRRQPRCRAGRLMFMTIIIMTMMT